MPLISIIIPAYNAEAYLQRCIDSIISQDFDNYEIICIDDGSTDDTPAILKRFPSVKAITQVNNGMATARNRGLDEAKGEYVMFVDSDDRLCSDALSTISQHLGNEDIIGFGTQIYNEATDTYLNNPVKSIATMSGWDYFNRYRLEVSPVHFVCIWQRVYRRAFLEKHRLRFTDGLRRAEDDLFTTMAMLHACSIKTIPDCLYTYHIRQNSITRSDNSILRNDADKAQQILVETFLPIQGIDKRVIYQVLASNFINHLSIKGNTLSPSEWNQFRKVCITPRHKRLYYICRISPNILHFYNTLCSSLR